MALPTSFKTILDLASESFGGYSELEKLLTQEDLEYLVQFPGFCSIIKPWALQIDLAEYNYNSTRPYTVLNKKFSYLYERINKECIFGIHDEDISVALNTPHGQYLHIHVPTDTGYRLGLLWVCNELSPAQKQKQIKVWLDAFESRNAKQSVNEIFLATDLLPLSSVVMSYFLPGLWNQQYEDQELKVHPNVQKGQIPTGEIVVLYPRQTGWYLFEYINESGEAIPLNVEDITGTGFHRIRSVGNTTHIELQNASLSGTRGSLLSASNGRKYTWLDNAQKMRVEGRLFFKDFGVSTGRANIEASYNTKQLLVPNELIGSTQLQPLNLYSIAEYLTELEIVDPIESEIFGSGFYGIYEPLDGVIFYGEPSGDDGSLAGSSSVGTATLKIDLDTQVGYSLGTSSIAVIFLENDLFFVL